MAGIPSERLAVGSNGVLYGTASYSGVANTTGTVFRLTPPVAAGGAWTYSALHTFPGGAGVRTDFGFNSDARPEWQSIRPHRFRRFHGVATWVAHCLQASPTLRQRRVDRNRLAHVA
jgi:hypothetical protein